MSKRKHVLIIIFGFVVFVACICLIRSLFCSKLLAKQLADPPCWLDLCIGKSKLNESEHVLGTPRLISERSDSEMWEVWIFDEQNVEVWVDSSQVIQVILIFDPREDLPSLDKLVEKIGRPDKVTWVSYFGWRYWLWPRYGIAANASKYTRVSYRWKASPRTWQGVVLEEVMLFRPMSLQDFLDNYSEWPFPVDAGPGKENPYPPDQFGIVDPAPENPYELSTISVSIPKESTGQVVCWICGWEYNSIKSFVVE